MDFSQWFPASLNMLFITSVYKTQSVSPQGSKPQDANYRMSATVRLRSLLRLTRAFKGIQFHIMQMFSRAIFIFHTFMCLMVMNQKDVFPTGVFWLWARTTTDIQSIIIPCFKTHTLWGKARTQRPPVVIILNRWSVTVF